MQSIPERYINSVIPHVMVKNAPAAIAFYKDAFDAEELFRLALPNGQIIHAELKIENSVFMAGEADFPFSSPSNTNLPSIGLHIYIKDVDSLALEIPKHNVEILNPLKNMFYGDRQIMLRDPFGHIWVFLTRIEQLTTDEIVKQAGDFLR